MEETDKYAGGAAQIRLKKKMTRHASRRPRPKTGASVPAENLEDDEALRSVDDRLSTIMDVREDIEVPGEPEEEYRVQSRVLALLDRYGGDACSVVQAVQRNSIHSSETDVYDQDYNTCLGSRRPIQAVFE
jgi:hypothetical protein